MAKATRKANYERCQHPGDYFIRGDRLSFLCPCGCGMLCGIKLGKSLENGAWKWDSNANRPTVRPSINIMNGPNKEHWHGWLTDGVFTLTWTISELDK